LILWIDTIGIALIQFSTLLFDNDVWAALTNPHIHNIPNLSLS